MNCPKCQNTEIDANGVCLVCGFSARIDGGARATAKQAASEDTGFETSSQSETTAADIPGSQVELPGWRQDLSRRLQEIKQRREMADGQTSQAGEVRTPVEQTKDLDARGRGPVPQKSAFSRKRRRPAQAVGRDLPLLADASGDTKPPDRPLGVQGEAPIFQQQAASFSAADVVIRQPDKETGALRWQRGNSLADTIIVKQPVSEESVLPSQEFNSAASVLHDRRDDKLILLSRTLSGLVDLIIVVVCASSLIFAADAFEGIEVFDTVSLIHFLLLLLAMYFVYSFFFLGLASQTIGMMLTDLQIVDLSFHRPKATQILMRCLAYLLGLAGLGIGLLWGCFDRHSRCLHDRLSDTRVIRAML